jgi:hypothetical protein
VNCWVDPTWMVEVAGATLTDERVFVVPAVTVRLAEPATPLNEACTLVDPAAVAVINPDLVIVATDAVLTLQVAVELTMAVVPSL